MKFLGELSQWSEGFVVAPLRPTEVLMRVGWLVSSKNRAVVRGAGNGATRQDDALVRLIGEHPGFVAMKRKLPLIARHGAPVLLTGETGTGKELFARALHHLSARAHRPFLPLNCGAIPSELFESVVFGHQKGAFTGAWADQVGLVEEAEGGTLFLDEIESLNLSGQVKLLRFIEDHAFHSVGSAKLRRADVWIIAATNLDLKAQIQHRTFREDLFYRLAVMSLALLPLRCRREDIPLLADHFWSQYAGSDGQEGACRRKR
jgi:transcriptional regulator with PAS, ATPase and Fis domain